MNQIPPMVEGFFEQLPKVDKGTLCYECRLLSRRADGWFCSFFDTVPHDIHTTRICSGHEKADDAALAERNRLTEISGFIAAETWKDEPKADIHNNATLHG